VTEVERLWITGWWVLAVAALLLFGARLLIRAAIQEFFREKRRFLMDTLRFGAAVEEHKGE
jgi:hypothetical protein